MAGHRWAGSHIGHSRGWGFLRGLNRGYSETDERAWAVVSAAVYIDAISRRGTNCRERAVGSIALSQNGENASAAETGRNRQREPNRDLVTC